MALVVASSHQATPVTAQESTPTPLPTLNNDPDAPVSYRVEKVVDAVIPTAIDWSPDGRMFYTELYNGRLWVYDPVTNTQNVVWEFPIISGAFSGVSDDERGLLGVAVSPDYAQTGYVYVYYTRTQANSGFNVPVNRIVRITESNGTASDAKVMLDIPTRGNLYHQGANIHFGPDGMLYLSIGDYKEASYAQNLDVIPGKIARFQVTDEGLVAASDNPFPGSVAFAYGLRNPYDFDFDPYAAPRFQILATDNGPECDDELNIIVAGGNYGWRPGYPCDDNNPQGRNTYIYPIWWLTPTEAPTGVAVYQGDQVEPWRGQVFFCTWNTGKMRRVMLDPSRTGAQAVREVDLQSTFCNLEVETGPDGALYFSNTNGIYRIVRQ
jgi:glucose/arabinose dehydrogenase